VLDAAVITAGSVATQLAIPDTLALAQQSLREQVVALELGAGGRSPPSLRRTRSC
jgi:hypothetical protein